MEFINISTSPLTGKTRKAEVCSYSWNQRDSFMELEICVWSYDANGNVINSAQIRPYTVFLKAENLVWVNPQTGSEIAEVVEGVEAPEGAVKDYDFLCALATTATALTSQITGYVTSADAKGKFDI